MGQDFLLQMYVQDTRTNPKGVFQAYFDANYDANLVSVDGPVIHGPAYNFPGSTSGDTATAGLIDEAGSIDTDQVAPNPRGAELLLFSVPFQAQRAGSLIVTADLADIPSHKVLFFDSVSGLLMSDIDFLGGSIEIEEGIRVTPTSGLTTTEAQGTATFTLVLSTQPTEDVTIGLSSSDTGEGTVAPTSVTFTTANWDSLRTVTVTGVNDSIVDGPVNYTITTAPATSADPAYDDVDADDVSVTNLDNDLATLTITAPTITETNSDQTVNFAVSVDRAVAGGFTVAFSGADGTADGSDYTVLTASPLVFAGIAGETQNIAVRIKGDQVVEGNDTFTLTLGAVTPVAPVPAGSIATGASATGTITNDDIATLAMSAPAITETNADQTVSFPVTLDRAVAGGFTVAFASTNGTADGSDYAVVTASPLVFTGTAGETKNIEVTIKGDQVVEGNETFTLTLGAVTPVAPVQAGSIVTGASTTGTIANDDAATLTISAPAIAETNT
ncbi:MAG: Calx-beta domain-containing protein, partial [Pirellulales bacterium]